MFTHKDKIIKDNTAKRKEWEKNTLIKIGKLI